MKVYFQGNFWGHMPKERAGKPIIFNQKFEWGGYQWLIPAAYICSKGLILDFCKQIPLPRIKEFLNCWKEKVDNNTISAEDREIINYENPLFVQMNVKAFINTREVESIRMCSVNWHPYQDCEEYESSVTGDLMEEYRCDRDFGWQFLRCTLPWPFKRKPKSINLTLDFLPEKILYPCTQHITVRLGDSGQQFEIQHPFTKQTYILHINRMVSEILPDLVFGEINESENPKHYSKLSYYFTPEVYNNEFLLQDCANSDKPRRIMKRDYMGSDYSKSSEMSIIGRAEGPTAIFIPNKDEGNQKQERYAISSFHFDQVQQVDWRISTMLNRGELLLMQFSVI